MQGFFASLKTELICLVSVSVREFFSSRINSKQTIAELLKDLEIGKASRRIGEALAKLIIN